MGAYAAANFFVTPLSNAISAMRLFPPPVRAHTVPGPNVLCCTRCPSESATACGARAGARGLILGHLSRENNRPELALAAVSAALAEAGEAPELIAAPPLGAVHMEALRCPA